jgi:hypothetical protein
MRIGADAARYDPSRESRCHVSGLGKHGYERTRIALVLICEIGLSTVCGHRSATGDRSRPVSALRIALLNGSFQAGNSRSHSRCSHTLQPRLDSRCSLYFRCPELTGRHTPTRIRWSKHTPGPRRPLLTASVKPTHLRCLATFLKIFQLTSHLLACFSEGTGGRWCDSRDRDCRILRGGANRYRLGLIGR